MAAAEELGAGTVHCCEAAWTDRLGERRSIVVMPRDGEAAQSYATRRLQWVGRMDGDLYLWGLELEPGLGGPVVRRRAEARRRAEKEIEARNVTISRSVPITASPAEAGACADAADAVLAVVDRTDAEWTAAGERAGRWWNALFAEQVRKRARRRYREAMDAAAREYAEAVGGVPARVRAEVVQATQAEQERQREIRAEEQRRAEARRQVIEAVDRRQVWLLLVEDETAYVKRSDVPPTAALPPADRPWSERLEPYALSLEIADLLYERMMVPPKVRQLVFDDAAVDAVRRELNAGDVNPDSWWDEHYRSAVEWVSDHEMRRRRGGYSSGGFS